MHDGEYQRERTLIILADAWQIDTIEETDDAHSLRDRAMPERWQTSMLIAKGHASLFYDCFKADWNTTTDEIKVQVSVCISYDVCAMIRRALRKIVRRDGNHLDCTYFLTVLIISSIQDMILQSIFYIFYNYILCKKLKLSYSCEIKQLLCLYLLCL